MEKRVRNAIVMVAGLFQMMGCAGERPSNLGVRDGLLSVCAASPNCVSSQATDERHRIAPLSFTGDPQTAFIQLKQVLGKRSDVTIVEEKSSYLQTELRTTFFVDDTEFLLDSVKHVIQVRSASRLGYSDLGKNRSRMEEIRREFTQANEKP